MGQNKEHKQCVQNINNKVKNTHSCYKEYPIFRNGDVHFLDIVGHLNSSENENLYRPFSAECECGSSRLQQNSNKMDLLAWEKQNKSGVIFQINNSEEFDLGKLKINNDLNCKRDLNGDCVVEASKGKTIKNNKVVKKSNKYLDSFDGSTKWNTLCTRLSKNNECIAKKSFKSGTHNLKIMVMDKAGNSIQKDVNFVI